MGKEYFDALHSLRNSFGAFSMQHSENFSLTN